MDDAPLLSILVPTSGRLGSLRETVRLLGRSETADVEVVVIDNSAAGVVREDQLDGLGIDRVRVLREPSPGKARALNRALGSVRLGSLIAILDDDMSPEPHWVSRVLNASERHPQIDVFAGSSYVVWPDGHRPPTWAEHDLAQGIAFSVLHLDSPDDIDMGAAGAPPYPSGNHFWFRSRALATVPRFAPVWATEPHFVTSLLLAGHRGMFVVDVRCGHRVQPELLQPETFLARARLLGIASAQLDRVRFDASAAAGPRRLLRTMKLRLRRMIEIPRWLLMRWRGRLTAGDEGLILRIRATWQLWRCIETLTRFGGVSGQR